MCAIVIAFRPPRATSDVSVMPARTSVAKRFEMFDHTVAEMEQRLLTVRAPGQMMTALRWGMDELDSTYAETSARVRATVACRDGCDFCCRVPVDVQAHEVFFAAALTLATALLASLTLSRSLA